MAEAPKTKLPTNLFAQVYAAFGGRSPGGYFDQSASGEWILFLKKADVAFCPNYEAVVAKLNSAPLFGCSLVKVVDG
jgi:hypothetical protein